MTQAAPEKNEDSIKHPTGDLKERLNKLLGQLSSLTEEITPKKQENTALSSRSKYVDYAFRQKNQQKWNHKLLELVDEIQGPEVFEITENPDPFAPVNLAQSEPAPKIPAEPESAPSNPQGIQANVHNGNLVSTMKFFRYYLEDRNIIDLWGNYLKPVEHRTALENRAHDGLVRIIRAKLPDSGARVNRLMDLITQLSAYTRENGDGFLLRMDRDELMELSTIAQDIMDTGYKTKYNDHDFEKVSQQLTSQLITPFPFIQKIKDWVNMSDMIRRYGKRYFQIEKDYHEYKQTALKGLPALHRHFRERFGEAEANFGEMHVIIHQLGGFQEYQKIVQNWKEIQSVRNDCEQAGKSFEYQMKDWMEFNLILNRDGYAGLQTRFKDTFETQLSNWMHFNLLLERHGAILSQPDHQKAWAGKLHDFAMMKRLIEDSSDESLTEMESHWLEYNLAKETMSEAELNDHFKERLEPVRQNWLKMNHLFIKTGGKDTFYKMLHNYSHIVRALDQTDKAKESPADSRNSPPSTEQGA